MMTDLEIKIKKYELRKRKKFSQAEVARVLGCERQTVNTIIKRRQKSRRIEEYINAVLST